MSTGRTLLASQASSGPFFLCRTQNRPQSFSHDYLFAGLDGHGYQLNVVGGFALFSSRNWIPLTNRRDQAGIVGTKHLDNRVPRAQLTDAIGNGVPPGLLIPGYFQSRIPVSIVGDVDARFYLRHRLHKFSDAIYAGIPFLV